MRVICRYYRRNDRYCSVGFEVVVLLVLHPDEGPLGPPKSFKEDAQSCQTLDLTEVGIWLTCTKREQRHYPPITQQAIRENRPVVEVRMVVDLVPQEPVWMASLVLPEQAPIHIDIPCV